MESNTGTVFRRLREQRGYSLSSFFLLDISKSALSKFERGEAMMGFDKVLSALQYMGVSLEEFEQFINNFTSGEMDNLISKIQKEAFRQNREELLELSIKAKDKKFHYISLAAKSAYEKLNFEEVDQITEYFYSIKLWGYKDLCIFYFTMKDMATKDILYVFQVFFEEKHELFQSTKARSYLVQTCCQAISLLSDRGYKNEAMFIHNKLEDYQLINTMYLRNLRNLSRGYWVYCFENKEIGKQMMKRALEILDSVGFPDAAAYYHFKYDKYVSIN